MGVTDPGIASGLKGPLGLVLVLAPPLLFGLWWRLVGSRDPRWRRTELGALLYLYPAFLVLFVFHLVPVVYSLALSFFQASAQDPFDRFVGLGNYLRLWSDPVFWKAMVSTAWYALLTVFTSIGVGLGVALLLNQPIGLRGFYRTMYFLPVVTSVAAVSLVWKLLYHPQRGAVNAALGLVGVPPQAWLEQGRGLFALMAEGLGFAWPAGLPAGPPLALCAVAVTGIWKSFGYNTVIFLAGLQAIPEELYDAATIDGASAWDRFRHVTWPLLMPTTFFVLIMSTINSFQVFAQIFMLYAGAATETSRVIVYYLYEKAFQTFDLGYASAMAYVLFILLFVLTEMQRRYVGSRVHYGNA